VNWQIQMTNREEVFQVCSGQKIEVRDESGEEFFTAVAPGEHTEELALVFATLAGVFAGGRTLISPVIAAGHRGLDLTVRRRSVVLHVRVRPALPVSDSEHGSCPLCRMKVETGSQAIRCARCMRCYHAECLAGTPRCPACGRGFNG